MIGVNYTKLMSVLTTVCKQKMPIVIFLKNGATIKSLSNVGVFETDNGEILWEKTKQSFEDYINYRP